MNSLMEFQTLTSHSLLTMAQLFDTSDFPARWNCGSWSSLHGWTHIVSDIAIFLAYMAIPIALGYFVRRRTDVPFPGLFWLFSAFILFCGVTHLVEATIFWRPWYRFSALLKACTAVVSWLTVASMLPVIPKALGFRSPSQLEAEVSQRTEQLAEVNSLLKGKNDELEQFVYTISHDLKTPLVTTRGFLGALKEDLGPINNDDVQDSIDRIDRATTRMGTLLDDLLELGSLGQVRNEPEWIDVNEVVNEVKIEIAPLIAQHHAEIRISGDLPSVYTDPLRFRQVLDNLISNAIKYGVTPEASTITISGNSVKDGCELRVADHGAGIPEEMRERVFLPFQRLKTDKEGTGIGLAIVARVMSNAGGQTRIEETPGGGTTFVVCFPGPAEDSEAAPQ